MVIRMGILEMVLVGGLASQNKTKHHPNGDFTAEMVFNSSPLPMLVLGSVVNFFVV